MDYIKGTWANDGTIESLGWLAVALVIFATWRSVNAIWGSYLFGLLFWVYLIIPGLGRRDTYLFNMLPYLVTIAVLIFISLLMPRMPDRVSRGACIGALITSVLCTLTAHGVNIPVVPSLPLYDLGLSWLIPAAVFGLAASLLPFRARSREKRIVPLPNEEH